MLTSYNPVFPFVNQTSPNWPIIIVRPLIQNWRGNSVLILFVFITLLEDINRLVYFIERFPNASSNISMGLFYTKIRTLKSLQEVFSQIWFGSPRSKLITIKANSFVKNKNCFKILTLERDLKNISSEYILQEYT